MDVATGSNLWAIAGHLYALTGAALVFGAFSQLANAASLFDSTDAQAASQRFDAKLGAGLVALGFFLQATGAVGNAAILFTPAVFLLLALALGLAIYAGAKDVLVDLLLGQKVTEGAGDVIVTEAPAKPQLITQGEPPLELEDLRTVPLRQRH